MATPILPAIQKTIDLARTANVLVIYTMHARAQRDPSSDYGMLEEWWGGDLLLHVGIDRSGAKNMYVRCAQA
jgi:isochorismate hydrolase